MASSPGLKRRFSSSSTRSVLAPRSSSSSYSRRRTGAMAYFGSGLPLGRPRWLHTVSFSAPSSSSHVRVSMGSRMRRSSVMTSPAMGTLKSHRTSTRLPESGRRSSSSGSCMRSGAADDEGQVDQAVRVAPFVVVPAEHLYQVPQRHRQLGVERAAGRRAQRCPS